MLKRAVLACGPAAAALALIVAPASAEAREAVRAEQRDSGMAEMTARLADPQLQHALGDALAAMTDALMDMRMAPLARVAESAGAKPSGQRIGPDTRLRDMAGPGAAQMQDEIRARVPQAMGAMAGMAGAMEAMLPQLQAMAEGMKDRMGSALPDRPAR